MVRGRKRSLQLRSSRIRRGLTTIGYGKVSGSNRRGPHFAVDIRWACSQEPMLSEAVEAPSSDDQVVDHIDAHDATGLDHGLSE
jgi:hypothetical protein